MPYSARLVKALLNCKVASLAKEQVVVGFSSKPHSCVASHSGAVSAKQQRWPSAERDCPRHLSASVYGCHALFGPSYWTHGTMSQKSRPKAWHLRLVVPGLRSAFQRVSLLNCEFANGCTGAYLVKASRQRAHIQRATRRQRGL
jgi:hypothetical protein